MKWHRKSHRHSDSDEGYRVTGIRDPQKGLFYIAWVRDPVGAKNLKINYEVGERVPTYWVCLGRRDELVDVMQLCDGHYERGQGDGIK